MKERFTYLQTEQIRLGHEHELSSDEVALYARRHLNWLQMEQMRLALEEHCDRKDVKRMARFRLSAARMERMRQAMKLGDRDQVREILCGGVTPLLWTECAAAVLFFLFSAVFLIGEMTAGDPALGLVCDETVISVRSVFSARDYLGSDEEVNARIVLPEDVRMRGGGDSLVRYSLTERGHRIDRTLLVHFRDDVPPELVLNASEIPREEYTDCTAYVEKAYDAVNGDLRTQVVCTEPVPGLTEQEIIFTVRDKAGNEARKSLRLVQTEAAAEKEYWYSLLNGG